MKNIILIIISIVLLCSCNQADNSNGSENSDVKSEIDSLLNKWHKDASEAKLDNYFNLMDSSFIYIGTDAAENWTKAEFKDFCEPFFKKGETWNFTALRRNIYVSKTSGTVWFYEILKTQMGTCRGSGVFEKSNNEWKIMQYVLSVAIPNEDMKSVIEIKSKNDSVYLKNLNTDV